MAGRIPSQLSNGADWLHEQEARARWPFNADQVAVRSLRTTAEAGRDIWGRQREQPVEISVTVAIRRHFQSAARDDRVDASTVHYGHLSKNILSAVLQPQKWLSTSEVASLVSSSVIASSSIEKVAACEIDIHYPKASTLGVGAGVVWTCFYRDPGQIDEHRDIIAISRVLYLRDVRIPVLIGVNGNERTKRQMVVLNAWIDGVSDDGVDKYVELENIITTAVEDSAFETLEALAEKVAREVHLKFINMETPGASLRLSLQKPSAVPLADAPAIQVYRTPEDMS